MPACLVENLKIVLNKNVRNMFKYSFRKFSDGNTLIVLTCYRGSLKSYFLKIVTNYNNIQTSNIKKIIKNLFNFFFILVFFLSGPAKLTRTKSFLFRPAHLAETFCTLTV